MKDAVMGFLRGYALKAITGLVGWRLQLAKLALKFAWPYVEKGYDWAEAKLKIWAGHIKVEHDKKTGEKNAEKVEHALQDGATEEDIEDSTTDLLNGKR